MSKRQAEFQIHNQPMTESENRAANMMNNQAPTKATPAQLAARKIREAKGNARRRLPGTSPAPTGAAFSNMQSAPFLPATNNTTTTFGANDVNGLTQQAFTAPSSSSFNFTASTGTNPFAGLEMSNPFSTISSSTPFGNQATSESKQGPIFGQQPNVQPASNSFSFNPASGLNNSFPQNSTSSIFSKSTPASNSFTFGTGSNVSQAPIFGAIPQTSNSDHDVSMEPSESPFKSPAKAPMLQQSTEAKSIPVSFGSSTPFSFPSTSHDTSRPSQGQNASSSQPIGTLFQISNPLEDKVLSKQQSEPAASTFNFLPNTVKPEKSAHENSSTLTSSQDVNPFVSLKPSGIEPTQDGRPASLFSFGMSPGPSAEEHKGTPSDRAINSFSTGGGASASIHQQTTSTSLQPFKSSGPIRPNPFELPKTTEFKHPEGSSIFGAFQPSSAINKEQSQAQSQAPASLNLFQSLNSSVTGKSAQASTQFSEPTKGGFQNPTSRADGTTKTNQFTPFFESKLSSQGQPNAGGSLRKTTDGMVSDDQNTIATSSTSDLKHSRVAKDNVSSNNEKMTNIPNQRSNRLLQPTGPGVAGAKKQSSETSKLFTRSLQESPVPTGKGIESMAPAHSQSEKARLSPRQSAAETQQKMDEAPSTSAANLAPANQPLKVKVKSLGALNIPQELNNDDFAEFDKSYRLRALNARFQKHIAELSPDTHDFEPVIRFYATQRAAIGYPMGGLYHRVKAGEKRKTEEVDHMEEAPHAAKKTKTNTLATTISQQMPPVFDFSSLNSVSTTSQAATFDQGLKEADAQMTDSHTTSDASTPSQLSASTSKTSNVFKSMLSSSNQPSFGAHQPSSASSSPPKSSPNFSPSKPSPKQCETSAPSTSRAMDKEALFFQPKTSTASAAAPNIANGTYHTPQAFQPKVSTNSTLQPPKFAVAGNGDFMAAFAAQAKKTAKKMEAENRAKRKAEDFDSDEDDEAEYERRAAEEDRAKRAKIEAIAKAGGGFTPVLSSASSINGASPAAEQDGESTQDASDKGSAQSDEDESESEQGQNDGEPDDSADEAEAGPGDQESDDDIQTAMAKSHAKAKKSLTSSSDPNSLFNRITKPDVSSGETKFNRDSGSSPTQAPSSSVLSAPPGTGLFGSRPTTPNLDSPNELGTSIFGNGGPSTPTGDHTWKPGSAIKFGASSLAPSFNITPATPMKANGNSTQSSFSSFSVPSASASSLLPTGINDDTPKASSGLFSGSPLSSSQLTAASGADTSKSFSTLFGDASKKTAVSQSSAANVGFSFGGPNKLAGSSFLAPSNVSSAITSRATSPGLTDNDSAAESCPDDQANDPQSDYMASRPGEENEEVLFEVRTKVLEFRSDTNLSAAGSKEEAGWKSRGLGPLRILKDKETGRTRIVMRSEPGANVIVNAPLIPDSNYSVILSGKEAASLKTGIYTNGKLRNFVFKVKTVAIANELKECLLANTPEIKGGESNRSESDDGKR